MFSLWLAFRRIPGLAALASLKLSVTAFSSFSILWIPGLAALASLKQDQRTQYRKPHHRIPGLAALASLKL